MALIDISVDIDGNLPTWQNSEPGVDLRWVTKFGVSSAECNVSRVSFGSHLGAHLDAPLHFVDGGASLEEIPLETLIGPAFVADLGAVDRPEVSAQDLEAAGVPADVKRLLLVTANSARRLLNDRAFHEDFVALGLDAARWVVERGIILVGIDYLSIGSAVAGSGGDVHRTLLRAGVVVVEGLNLHAVPAGRYGLCCLPLKIVGAEGSPVRAVLSTDHSF